MNESDQIARLQNENEQLKQQLLQAQKLTALGELVSTTTHEFNNVLMTIINYAKIGLRNTDQPTRDKSFQKVLAAGERAARITNSVLGMARNRTDRFEATDLQQIVDETLVLLDREMSKYRITVERDFSPVPNVFANGNQIQQVLLNLMINARQAMSHGGLLLIRISHDPDSTHVDLTVRDNGAGIPREELPKIFNSFYTTKSGPDESGKGGTGLGLAACREIVEAHRGRIRVESTPGKGTAFIIRLPVVQETKPVVLPVDASVGSAETVQE